MTPSVSVAVDASPYARRKRRAEQLIERWPFAAEVLGFYTHLLEAQEDAFAQARSRLVPPAGAAAFAASQVLPRIVEISVTHGPAVLQSGVLARFDAVDLEATCEAWLRGDPLDRFDRFLARASTQPVLEALGPAAAGVCTRRPEPGEGLQCTVCGGPPQVSYFAASAEDLVTPHRYLECARCASSWAFARMRCANCGETDSQKLRVYNEVEERGRFAHMRIDTCVSCSTYMLTVDVGRDGNAVPAVDELAAIPLDIYARELGLQKAVVNLMGF
jgi:formate dehydrogenase maturation protein FdhE